MTTSVSCTKCETSLKSDANFCPRCGTKVISSSLQNAAQGNITKDILSLANDLLLVKQVETNLIDFKTNSESKGWLGKIKISFSGRAKLDPEKKVVTYWDMMKKTSSGLGGENMGFSKESYVITGLERSGTGAGFVLGGEKYSYDYGKVRELVRAVVEKNGWKFKVTLIKPKWWK